jgi:hypothetical protein
MYMVFFSIVNVDTFMEVEIERKVNDYSNLELAYFLNAIMENSTIKDNAKIKRLIYEKAAWNCNRKRVMEDEYSYATSLNNSKLLLAQTLCFDWRFEEPEKIKKMISFAKGKLSDLNKILSKDENVLRNGVDKFFLMELFPANVKKKLVKSI